MSHLIVPSEVGNTVHVGGLGITFKIGGESTGGSCSIVEHTLEPRALGAPMHRHRNEDECSFVIEGRIGAKLGDDVVQAGPGDLIFKPRGRWHTFWNASDEPARFLEIITPAGFEDYFAELPSCFAGAAPDFMRLQSLASRFDLEVDTASIPEIVRTYGLVTG